MLSSMFDMPEVAINVMVAGVHQFIQVTDVSVHGRGVSQDLRW